MSKQNRIVIPCRMAYLNCWRPTSVYGGQKYSVSVLIPKEDTETIEKIHAAIEYVKAKSVGKWGGKIPGNLKNPLHDGDKEKPEDPNFKNCYYLNAKSTEAPQIVDQKVEPITDQTEVYSGCYGNVSVAFYGYSCSGNRGIGVWLGNIQKIKDGPPIGGRIVAREEFKPLQTEDIKSLQTEDILQ